MAIALFALATIPVHAQESIRDSIPRENSPRPETQPPVRRDPANMMEVKRLSASTTKNSPQLKQLPPFRNASGTIEHPLFGEERSGMMQPMELRATLTKKLTENRQEILKKLEEKRGEKVKKMAVHSENIVNAILRNIEKLEEAAAKLDTKIGEVSARGINTTSAKTTLDMAQAKLTEAKSYLVDAQATADTAAGQTVSKENATKLRETLKNAEKSMVEAHKNLQEATKALRQQLTTN